MSASTPARIKYENAAELIERMGGIPPNRIRIRPNPGTAVEQDVIDLESHEKRLCELIDGVLVEKTVGYKESLIASFLIKVLRDTAEGGAVLPGFSVKVSELFEQLKGGEPD